MITNRMRKALTILGISVGVIFLSVLAIAFVVANRESEYFSPPDEPRAWATSRYNSYLVDPKLPLPVLSAGSSRPIFDIDDSDPSELKVKWTPETRPHQIAVYGDRIDAGTGKQEITLPNGQIIRLVAIALASRPEKLPDVNSEYDGRNVAITWHNPVSLEPIQSPESLNLPKTFDVQQEAQLIFAFSCSDFESRPVRWHWTRIFDVQTQQSYGGSMTMFDQNNLQIYSSQVGRYHSSPLRLALAVSYGEAEVFELDVTKTGSKVQFSTGLAEVETVWAADGYQSGSSSRSQGADTESGFRIRPAEEKSYRKSFSLIYVHPIMQGYTMEYERIARNGDRSWRSIYPNNGIISLQHPEPMENVGPMKFRQYPHLATGIFRVSGIPGLPKLENLFDAKVGPVRLKYEHDIRQLIEHATALQWNHHSTSLDRSLFPLEFEDPDTTAADVLREYESLIDKNMEIDLLTHQIGGPELSPFEKFKDWITDKLRRIF